MYCPCANCTQYKRCWHTCSVKKVFDEQSEKPITLVISRFEDQFWFATDTWLAEGRSVNRFLWHDGETHYSVFSNFAQRFEQGAFKSREEVQEQVNRFYAEQLTK